MLIDADNINQPESQKWVRHIFKNTRGTCFISNISREFDWECSQICQRPPSQLGRVRHIFKDAHSHVLHPIFQDIPIGNGLRYVRKLQVMLLDNINQPESHKWVRHIFKNTYGTCFISNISREFDWKWSHICQRPPSHAHRRGQC